MSAERFQVTVAAHDLELEVRRGSRSIDLRLYADGDKWVGPSVTVHLPEVGYDFSKEDGCRFAIQPGYVSHSSGGGSSSRNNSALEIEASIWLITYGRDELKQSSAEMRPRLEEELADVTAKWEASMEEAKANAEQQRVVNERRDEIIQRQVGLTVRVTRSGRKFPIVLKELLYDAPYLQGVSEGREVRISRNQVAMLEVKLDGRFQDTGL